jgi:hypothetical protein
MKTRLCGTIRLPGSCGAERDFRKKYGETDADDIVCNEPLRDEHVAIRKNTNRKLNDMGDAFKAGRGQVRRIRETGESISVLHRKLYRFAYQLPPRPNII